MAAVASLLLASAQAQTPDRVIILSRHGVRRQFPSSVFNFSLYAPGKHFDTSDEAWGAGEASWGFKTVLTKHGYSAVERMGEYQAQRYAQLLQGCSASDSFVYCEEDMPRDEKTAEAFFKGLGCEMPPIHTEGVEYLIDQGSHPRGDQGQCRLASEAETEGRVGGRDGIREYERLYKDNIRKLGDVLGCCAPELCNGQQNCTLDKLPSAWDAKHWYTTWTGPFYAGKYFGEWFELTMLNGMDFAFGKLSVDKLMELTSFVTQYREFEFDLLAAKPFGSTLLAHISATLMQWTGAKNMPPGALAHSAERKLVYYAAHDTNLKYVGELLGLKWLNKGWQPNHTPPGGALVFEVYAPDNEHNPTGMWAVRAFFDVQTPQQVRNLTKLTDASAETQPSRSPITIPGCSIGPQLICPVIKLAHIVGRAVANECITPLPLRDYALQTLVLGMKETLFSTSDEHITFYTKTVLLIFYLFTMLAAFSLGFLCQITKTMTQRSARLQELQTASPFMVEQASDFPEKLSQTPRPTMEG